MHNAFERPIIILGCERSGSTWLFNILDSDPNTVSIMEPFADYAGLFPGFPHRFFYMEKVSEPVLDWVQGIVANLIQRKYGFLYSPGKPLWLKKLDGNYIRIINQVLRVMHAGRSNKIEQYQLLNLNELAFKKNALGEHCRIVIKELRLNYKVHLVKSLFPNGIVLVAIRNPVLQIDSIIKRFNKGNLGELKRSLLFFKGSLFDHPRFQKYQDLIEDFDNRDLVEQLAIYWLISYNTLVEDLENAGIKYTLASNDLLSLEPVNEINRILRFCDIDLSKETKTYLESSTQVQSHSDNPINTSRESRKYYLESLRGIDSVFENRVMKVLKDRMNSDIQNSLENVT
ncbi:MAG: sulfotransferase [Cyclobacteriaceae bacterium]|nr:sulfotransferase [Cyclobacteriaceae bacterium]